MGPKRFFVKMKENLVVQANVAIKDKNMEEIVATKDKDDSYTLKVKEEYVLTTFPACVTPLQQRRDLKDKARGMNRKRPRDKKEKMQDKVCISILQGEPCKFETPDKACTYSHDLQSILVDREPDIQVAGSCPSYDLFGKCPFGVLCRLGECHLNMATGENLTQDIPEDGKPKPVLNVLSRDVQVLLRKDKYPFKTNRHWQESKGKGRNNRETNKKVEAVCDLAPLPEKTRKLIDFSEKVYVAPLTTVGNLPFRRIMKKFGADITCGEMALGKNLLSGQPSEWALLKRHPSEDVFGVQIACGHADMYGRVAELIENECSVDFMDLNLGCPIDLLCDMGCGAAVRTSLFYLTRKAYAQNTNFSFSHFQRKMMHRDKKLKESLETISKILTCPITVKMRTGWDEKKPFAHELVPKIQTWQIPGLASIMVCFASNFFALCTNCTEL